MSAYAEPSAASGSSYAQGGGSAYAAGPDGAPAHGGGNVFTHLVSDIGSAVVNLPGGIVQAVEHPVGTAKAIGRSYADTYGPLVHGHVSEFLHGLQQHPLGPLLDLATVVTLGAGGVAKAGAILGEHGLIDETSALARLGQAGARELRSPGAVAGQDGARVAHVPTSRNPVIRARQNAVDAALKKLPYDTRVVGELARYGRETRKTADRGAAALRLKAVDYTQSFAALSKQERLATSILARIPLPDHLDAWKQIVAEQAAKGDKEAAHLQTILTDPQVNQLYREPTPAMLKAHAAADQLGKVAADTLDKHGALPPELADAARYRHTRIAAGATVYTPGEARAAVRRIDTQLRHLGRDQEKTQGLLGKLRTNRTPEIQQLRREGYKTVAGENRLATGTRLLGQAQKREETLRAQLHDATAALTAATDDTTATVALHRAATIAERYDRAANDLYQRAAADLPSAEHLAGRRAADVQKYAELRTDLASRLTAGRNELDRLAQAKDDLTVKRGTIHPGIVGADIPQMQKLIADAGRPQPIYLPDKPLELPRSAEKTIGAARDISLGSTGYAEKVRAAAKSPVHQSEGYLFRMGHLALEPDTLTPEFLRTVKFSLNRDLHDLLLESAVQVHKGGRLPAGHVWLRRPASLKDTSLDRLVGDEKASPLADRGFQATSESEALTRMGARYAVPEKLVQQVQGEFRKADSTLAQVVRRPLEVWRALVLNLSPRWLVNNVVGNHLLYALQQAGPSGLRAYLNMVQNTHGVTMVRRLLGDEKTRGITDHFMRDLFPEQAGGTFVDTQLPRFTGRVSGRLAKVGTVGGKGLAPADRTLERNLRTATTEAELRKLPEVRRKLREMPKETRTFEDAAREALAEHPLLAREVSDKVNATLGDFTGLSRVERDTLRQFLPFYAWYRAILGVTAKLALDSPGRADIIQKLSEVGAENQQFKLPSFLEGAVGLGGNRILKTQGLNPLATVVNLGQAAGAVPGALGVPGFTAGPQQANAALGLTNPFLSGLFQYLVEHTSPTQGGHPKPGLFADILRNLPEVKPAISYATGPTPSRLYQPSALDDLLSYLGAPMKTVNPGVAAVEAAQGR